MAEKPFFITTPIYYINSTPHVGHAYTQIAADARARFERLRGREVYFLTGTDENALKVARVAVEQGRDPLEFCDELAAAVHRGLAQTQYLLRRFHPHHPNAPSRAGAKGRAAIVGRRVFEVGALHGLV